MKIQLKKSFASLAWFFYFLIVFEIIYMIMPFFALSFYSFYGPSLNFLHQWPATTWLSSFFLPHLAETSSALMNGMNATGRYLFLISLFFFLIGAGQIYYAKFTKKGAVTGGLYKYVRHPQYTSFAVMGLGLTLVWPRFIILIMYVTMLFVYYFLARKEENECLRNYGDSYQNYLNSTAMFFPGDQLIRLPSLPASGLPRVLSIFALYSLAILASVLTAFGLRDYSIKHLSKLDTENSVTVSLVKMNNNTMEQVLGIATKDPEVSRRISLQTKESTTDFLNYISPISWFVADLPMEAYEEGMSGHYQPQKYDKNKYKILFTHAVTHKDESHLDILKNTYKRIPIVVVEVDLQNEKVIGIKDPPPHVVWGDIPTPLF